MHLKWYSSIKLVNFYLKPEDFFSHDFTLIASVMGESVIGHGILTGNITHLNGVTR